MIIRTGVLVKPRIVKLSCGHEQKDPARQIGDQVGCLQCPQTRVFRSKLCLHTTAKLRKVVEVVRLP